MKNTEPLKAPEDLASVDGATSKKRSSKVLVCVGGHYYQLTPMEYRNVLRDLLFGRAPSLSVADRVPVVSTESMTKERLALEIAKLTGRPIETGKYNSREQLTSSIWIYESNDMPHAEIARETGATLKVVNSIIKSEEGMPDWFAEKFRFPGCERLRIRDSV